MTGDMDTFERIPLPRDMRWPNDRRIAVVFNIAYEMWSPGATSGVGPMGNVLADGLFDPNADSYGRYNATVGAERLLNIATQNGVSASVLTSAMIAEADPAHLEQIADAGHEIVAHGFAQNEIMPTLSPEQRKSTVERCSSLLNTVLPRPVLGWISPRVTSGPDTHRLLAKAGYAWHGDAIDDDLPYVQKFEDSEILAVPMSVEFNDLPHAMRFGRTPRQFVELVTDTLEALPGQKNTTIILDVFAHGHCYGRPAAAWAIDEIMKRCVDDADLWVTTRSDIQRHCKAVLEASRSARSA